MCIMGEPLTAAGMVEIVAVEAFKSSGSIPTGTAGTHCITLMYALISYLLAHRPQITAWVHFTGHRDRANMPDLDVFVGS